jgi:hypothetical protein
MGLKRVRLGAETGLKRICLCAEMGSGNELFGLEESSCVWSLNGLVTNYSFHVILAFIVPVFALLLGLLMLSFFDVAIICAVAVYKECPDIILAYGLKQNASGIGERRLNKWRVVHDMGRVSESRFDTPFFIQILE